MDKLKMFAVFSSFNIVSVVAIFTFIMYTEINIDFTNVVLLLWFIWLLTQEKCVSLRAFYFLSTLLTENTPDRLLYDRLP